MRYSILILPVLCCAFVAPGGTQTAAQGQQPGVTTQGAPGITPLPQQSTAPLSPYATTPGATLQTPSFGGTGFDPYSGETGQPGTLYGQSVPPGSYAAPPGTIVPPYTAYPTQPPALFPHGIFTDPNGVPYPWNPPIRFVQGIRLRYTWVNGGDGSDELGINDFDINGTFAPFPNFLFSGQPLLVTPGFALHLWSGPAEPTPADLPAQAYSAFLDFAWNSNPNNPLGAELGGRVGVFTDFDTFTSDSVRMEGLALLTYRLSPTCMLKGGAVYLDRNRVKLLPAGGLLWTPNPQTRFDIFFPQPKLAQFLTTLGTTDLWWYVAGEYGGGNWTVDRDNGFTDSMDINDIRLMLGVEWIRDQRQVASIEVGWVTDREIVYRYFPDDGVKLNDSIMLRGLLAF